MTSDYKLLEELRQQALDSLDDDQHNAIAMINLIPHLIKQIQKLEKELDRKKRQDSFSHITSADLLNDLRTMNRAKMHEFY